MVPQNLFLSIIALSLFLFPYPTNTAAEKDAYELANEFCSKRRTSDDRNFCLEVLKSDPTSAAAEDHSILLKIAVHAAEENAKRILDYMSIMFKSKSTNITLKPVLKDCLAMYRVMLNEFEGINKKLAVNPSMARLDARVANDEIRGCQKIVESENVSDTSISNRNKIAEDYGVLVEDIANLV